MLKDVNQLIPNNLCGILSEKNLTIADCVRKSGLTRPTVKKLVDGEDSYISKMKILADSIGVSLSAIYSNVPISVHQDNNSYNQSSMSPIGYQVVQGDARTLASLEQRIKDLENLVRTKDELLASKDEILSLLRNKD